MDTLPPEMIVEVSRYLSVRDLSACCAVSRLWRQLFNLNQVWRPRCQVTRKQSLVNSPETSDSSLSPLCVWRQACNREHHLWSKWRHGDCRKHIIIEESSESQMRCQVFMGDNHVLVMVGDKIEVWDVTTTAVLSWTEYNTLHMDDINFYDLKTVDDFLIIVQGLLVQVVKVDLTTNRFLWKHAFIVVEKAKLTSHMVEELKMMQHVIFDQQSPCSFCRCVLLGKTLVCCHSMSLHIWDLQEGIKLKEEDFSLLESQEMVMFIKHSLFARDNILVELECSMVGSKRKICYVYSLEKLNVFKFITSFTYHVCCELAIYGEYVISWCDGYVLVFHYPAFLLVAKVCHNIRTNQMKSLNFTHFERVCKDLELSASFFSPILINDVEIFSDSFGALVFAKLWDTFSSVPNRRYELIKALKMFPMYDQTKPICYVFNNISCNRALDKILVHSLRKITIFHLM